MGGDIVTIRAAGGVVWRPVGDGCEVVLVHRPRYDDWTFPKGKLDADETWQAGARREVEEETGVQVSFGPELATVRYRDQQNRHKTVRYWAMAAEAVPAFTANDEVDRIVWLTPSLAHQRLSYRRDRDVLAAFVSLTEQ